MSEDQSGVLEFLQKISPLSGEDFQSPLYGLIWAISSTMAASSAILFVWGLRKLLQSRHVRTIDRMRIIRKLDRLPKSMESSLDYAITLVMGTDSDVKRL